MNATYLRGDVNEMRILSSKDCHKVTLQSPETRLFRPQPKCLKFTYEMCSASGVVPKNNIGARWYSRECSPVFITCHSIVHRWLVLYYVHIVFLDIPVHGPVVIMNYFNIQ